MARVQGDAEHLVRVAALFGAGLIAFLVLRALLVPEGFGLYGHYRAGAIADNRADELVHAGRAACAACHDDAEATLTGGVHKGLSCEGCHGPLARHAADPSSQAAIRPDGRELCLRCHAANVARPVAFPQVDIGEHAPEGSCIDCHTAHTPGS